MQWHSGSAMVHADSRISTRGNCIFLWRVVGETIECTAMDLVQHTTEISVTEPIGPFPIQLIPASDACIVLRFGACSFRVSRTGFVDPLLHSPFVGSNHVIYNGRGLQLGVSPFGVVGAQWIWGDFSQNYVLLSESGMATFYEATGYSSAVAPAIVAT